MIMITGANNIAHARLITLKYMLSLEIKGLKRRGRSAYSIIKSELGFHGNRERVLAQLTEYLENEDRTV